MKYVKITELSLHVMRLCLLHIVEIMDSTLWLQLAKQVVRTISILLYLYSILAL